MGIKGDRIPKQKSVLTESKIQDALKHQLSNPRFLLHNLYVFGWESDVLMLTQSGYWYEYEIKISRADFKNDFKHKNDKHIHSLSNLDHTKKPNYFSYVVPENMISIDEVPEYAGLIYVFENGGTRTIKAAPKLHKEKNDPKDLNLVDKFYYNMVSAKNKANEIKRDIKSLNNKYADSKSLEKLSFNKGFDAAHNLAFEAFMKSCPHYNNADFYPKCNKDNQYILGRCRGNCDHMEKFLNEIDELKKKNGY
jgi:hypothetical protein